MWRPKETRKVRFKISEVAEMSGVAQSAIRFYEGFFEWLRPAIDARGYRRYNRQQVNRVLDVVFLIHTCGVSIEGVGKAYQRGYLADMLRFFKKVYADKKPKYLLL